MRKLTALTTALLLAAAQGCADKPGEVAQPDETPAAAAQEDVGTAPAIPPGGSLAGTVVETMDAGGYTYVQVDTGEETIWAAAPQFAVEVGEKVTVPEGMPMPNYHSATLDRDFELVYFVATIMKGDEAASAAPGQAPASLPAGAHPSVSAPQAGVTEAISFEGIARPEGGRTVEEIWSEKNALEGQEVTVRGRVVKFNSQVMGVNWLHVQDGTGGEGTNDLTVTTSAVANVGDTVLVTGPLTLNKDFGFGYRYDVIIEKAEVIVE